MKIEDLLIADNLFFEDGCVDFTINGHYKKNIHFIMFELRYVVKENNWVVKELYFFTTLKDECIKQESLIKNTILRQAASRLEKTTRMLNQIRTIEMPKDYTLELQNGQYKRVRFPLLLEEAGDVFVTLNEKNELHEIVFLTKEKNDDYNLGFIQHISWLQNLEAFRLFLLNESKDRLRLLMKKTLI